MKTTIRAAARHAPSRQTSTTSRRAPLADRPVSRAELARQAIESDSNPRAAQSATTATNSGDEAATKSTSHLRSVHTDTFAELLARRGISLAVTTYQAGYVVLLRHDGQGLNTHFRQSERPMGLAARDGRLAVGAAKEIVQFRNMHEISSKLDGPFSHDACYTPRHVHVTGDIDVHEMAWGIRGDAWGTKPASQPAKTAAPHDELWFVNTRFSCLCTVDTEFSFVPRWRPRFVSGLAPEDRCHLNGLCMIDGRPRFVTALGESNEPQGWRSNKASGGVLIDVDSGETVCRGLSMPHSPRWHEGRLWVLESGRGGIGYVDLASGRYQQVAQLDGFTRGLSICGSWAFVGLSQVRESASFSGIPLVARVHERRCGVAVVNIESGHVVGYMHFEDAVQEVFAVEALPHCFPEILEPGDQQVTTAFALPDSALHEVEAIDRTAIG